MHEFSVAQNIVEIVIESFEKSDANKIYSVEIDVGTLSGVIIDALEFALDSAVKGTVMEKSKIKINNIHAKALCNKCHKEFTMNDFFTNCSHCGSLDYKILEGKELKVKSIEVE